MDLKVEYIYVDIRNVKQNIVYIHADINDDTPVEEIDCVLKPLIGRKTGHNNIKSLKSIKLFNNNHIDTLFNLEMNHLL